ncbi:MAG: hypothetical protein ACI9U6_001681 [Loktanella salsilacus]|jgi:hypothetical protein|uniref:hypothetical protein n=1 Tax=Loktanella salsilacus TaxID=195913 RepID=UPI003561AF99
MINRAVPVAILLATLPLSAFAQGITGGDLGIEYNAPLDGSDFGGTTYSGGVEYGFMRTFSMSVNAAAYKPDNISTTATNVTLHGTYQLSSAASVGGFYGYDSIDGEGLNLFGIEGGTEFMGGDVGAYIGRAEDDGTIFGIDGSYDLRSGFSVIGNVDLIDVDDARLTQASIGAEYQMAAGPQFYTQIGRITGDVGDDSDSVGFFTIGAKVAFGAARGTTFDNRSIFEVIPGF